MVDNSRDERTFGEIKYGGANFIASLLRYLAMVIALAGLLGAIIGGVNLHNDGSTGAIVAGYVAVTLIGAIVSAGLLAAAGYAISLLIDIYNQTAEARYLLEDQSK